MTILADSDAEAERLYAKHALYFYNRCLHLYPGFANPPGYTSEATIRQGMEGQIKLAADRNKELQDLVSALVDLLDCEDHLEVVLTTCFYRV